MKLCTQCKHYVRELDAHYEQNWCMVGIDFITGELDPTDCVTSRSSLVAYRDNYNKSRVINPCTPAAIYFEWKDEETGDVKAA